MPVDLGDYIDVAARIAEFRAKYPDGSLQPADLSVPYRVEKIGEQTFIVVVAAAYRSPLDERPGIGMAYEVFPGRTPYTKGSELQNAETSAWGRAIVAALAADTKKGIASQEEVRNRQAERESFEQAKPAPDERKELRRIIGQVGEAKGHTPDELKQTFAERHSESTAEASIETLAEFLSWLQDQPDKWEVAPTA